MNLKKILDALVRRWWVAVPVILMTLGAVIWIASGSNVEYEARARLLLATPELVGEGTGAGDQGREPTLDPVVVREIVEGDATLGRLGVVGDAVDYSVIDVGEGIFRIEAVSSSDESVLDVASAVIDEVERVVADLDEADPEHTAEVQILSQPRFVRERTIEADDGVETEFFARGSLALIIKSASGAATAEVNPYSASDGTLRVLEEVVSTDAVLASVRDEVGDQEASFELQFDQRDAAPLVHVVATATTPETTMATLDSVLSFLDADLAERQALAGAAESTFVRFQRLAIPDEAEIPEGSLRRPIATIIVLGMVGAVSLAVFVDSLMSRPTGEQMNKGRRRDDRSNDLNAEEEPVQTHRSRVS